MQDLTTYQHYLQFEKRFSEHTIQAYLKDIEQCLNHLSNQYEVTSPSDITPQYVRSWVVHLMESGISPRSVNRKLSSLRSYFRFLRKRDVVEYNVFERVTGPKSHKRLPSVVPEKAMQRLFEEIRFPEGFEGWRDRLILELLYTAGLRRSELLGLKWTDIDSDRSTLKVHGKGKKQRIVPFGNGLKATLNAYRKAAGDAGVPVEQGALIRTDRGRKAYPKFIYNTVRRYLGAVTTSAQRGPHALRHSFATHLTEAGADINAIKELLGHSSLAATQIYTQTSIKRLKASYDQAHPKA